MEFEQGYRYAQHANIGYPLQPCQYNGRNGVLAVSNGVRADPRVCPVRGPMGGARLHLRGGRDDENETGQARRRVAVACARCRKRKIRCSGDPGDGSGCQNCNAAGVDPTSCAFHRVGSGEATSMIDLHHNLNQIANSHAIMQTYNGPASPVRSRPLTYPPGLDTKSLYQQTWYSPPYNPEETSPIETYGLDQPTPFLPNQSSVTFSGNYGWSLDSKPTLNNYMNHDPAMYRTQGLPYTQHGIRNAASSEALSHSMTSLQLTLPERPHTRSGLPASQRPQLPIPQPSPAQSSRNAVDQLQDQRLRSVQAVGGSSLGSGGFVKPPPPFSSDADVQITTSAEALATQITASAPASTTDSVSCYPNIAPTTTENIPASAAPHFNFSTLPLFDTLPMSTQPAYSNFRDSQEYKPATSSPTRTITPMDLQMSHTDLYSIANSSNSRAASSGNNSTLVSGQRYTPLSHSQSQQHQTALNGASRKTGFPMHRTPTAALNRSF